MKFNRLLVLLCLLFYVQLCHSWLISAGIVGAGIFGGYEIVKCKFFECCTKDYVANNLTDLRRHFKERLYGQHIAQDTVLGALVGHFQQPEPKKALSLSFHGLPGSGKNYVANMIAESMYKTGLKSSYYHYYNARIDFPHDNKVSEYQDSLNESLLKHLKKCETSLFVFDEVDKMPEGVLNVLVPFLDYGSSVNWENRHVSKNKAVYVFLSNTGSSEILSKLLRHWQSGKKREEVKLQDFEDLITLGAFNEKGGFHKSEIIESSVIDHYVPFLPLEEIHVKQCIEYAFKQQNFHLYDDDMITEAISHVTFGPPTHKIYAKTGCKRLEQKVATVVYRHKHKGL